MGRKRKGVPERLDPSKQQRLAWNMSDLTTERLLIVPDDVTEVVPMEASKGRSGCTVEKSSATDWMANKLSGLINECDFYIRVGHDISLSKESGWCCHLGNFVVHLTNAYGIPLPASLPADCSLWLYVSSIPGKHLLYIESTSGDISQEGMVEIDSKGVLLLRADINLPYELLEGLQYKAFRLEVQSYNPSSSSLDLRIVATEAAITKLQFSSEGSRHRKVQVYLQTFMAHLHGFHLPDYSGRALVKKHDVRAFFRSVRGLQAAEQWVTDVNVQHPDLRPRLRPYQRDAVIWMLHRERLDCQAKAKEKEKQGLKKLHSLYEEFHTLDGQQLFYNKHGGCLVRGKPLQMVAPPGGILADEMGLGKTVEVLACMMAHPRRNLPALEPLPVIAIDDQGYIVPNPPVKEENVESLPANPVTELVHLDHDYCQDPNAPRSPSANPDPDSSDTETCSESGEEKKVPVASNNDSHTDNNSDELPAADGVGISGAPPGTDSDVTTTDTGAGACTRGRGSTGAEDGQRVGPKTCFECICGVKNSAEDDEKLRVQCLNCGLWQHAECVHYNLADPYRGPYLCPHCHVTTEPLPSGATLIISPLSISHQWVDEIKKHIHKERLKVFVYGGVHKHGFLQPRFLASHDIVITTYEMLQKEINYVDLPHSNSEAGRRFRHPKRFMAIPSPIIAVEWWRICLDEAQMVECTTTKSAEMALRLSAVNKWCVTGTPIQKGLSDLYGLLLFLGEDPYWVQPWWMRLLYTPYCYGDTHPMHKAIAKVMWRTCKDDVIDQICLPTQSEEVHWLAFSPVEEHFYKRTFSQCANDGLASLSKWPDASVKLNSVDRYTLHALLGPLTKMRQACCHPQAVRGSFLPIQKSTMTMEELLVSMTKKVRLECQDAHRQLVAAMNGIAGLHIIKQEWAEAVEMYREVLRSINQHNEEIQTDQLQQLHTLHNLAEVLDQKPTGVPPTLRDDQLKKEAKEVRSKYLQKAATFVEQATEAWAPLRQSLRQLQAQLAGSEDWWADLLQWIIYIGVDELLVERVRSDLLDNLAPNKATSLAHSFRDARGLEYVLLGELEALDAAHDALIENIERLQAEPSAELIHTTVDCCLRPAAAPLKTCPFCKVHEFFEDYENKLFSFTDKGVSEVSGLEGESFFNVGTRRQGTWGDSETERTIKAIINFAKGYGGMPTASDGRKLLEIGNVHLKIIEALKKEFKVVRILWIELRAQVSAHDELNMATTRLRLRLEDEPISVPPQPNILEAAELDSQRLKVKSDRIISQNLLRRKLGQLVYLKNLEKAQSGMEGGENPEPCPVCQRTLGKKWAVLTCGHCYCLDCVRILLSQHSFGGHNVWFKCPMCRQRTCGADINYVSTGVDTVMEEVSIKGDHSTKVEGVVRCVLRIIREEPQAKMLIFSVWQNVMNIVAQALTDNEVSHVSLLANNRFQKNLNDFKTQENIRVLLLPVHSGANGLNLVEATHVLLVEPILNPSQELQAIGRVHRIGQTRPTFVHRFLVRNTIEERLHHLLAVRGTTTVGSSNKADDTPFTIGDLRNLYLESQLGQADLEDTDHEVPLEGDSGTSHAVVDSVSPLEGTSGGMGSSDLVPGGRTLVESSSREQNLQDGRNSGELLPGGGDATERVCSGSASRERNSEDRSLRRVHFSEGDSRETVLSQPVSTAHSLADNTVNTSPGVSEDVPEVDRGVQERISQDWSLEDID